MIGLKLRLPNRISETKKPIFKKVKKDGDNALKYYSEKFDGLSSVKPVLSKPELIKIAKQCPGNQYVTTAKQFITG